MAKMLNSFNTNYHKNLAVIQASFTDVASLQTEVQTVSQALSENPNTSVFYDEFSADLTQDIIDAIYKKQPDEGVFGISLFSRIGMHEIYTTRMFDDEKTVFWTNLQQLCKKMSMLRACGDNIFAFEEIAKDIRPPLDPANPTEAKKTLEELPMKLLQEMLSGGEMSKKIMKTFQQKDCLKNIVSNVGNIVGNQTDLGSMIDLGGGDDETLDSIVKGVGEMVNADDAEKKAALETLRRTTNF